MSAGAVSGAWGAGVRGVLLRPGPRPAEVHVLLLDDLLLLLQRQDERLLLKSHSRTLTPTPDGKTMLRPVLRLTSAITREVATGEAPPAGWGASERAGERTLAPREATAEAQEGEAARAPPSPEPGVAGGPGALWALGREPRSSPGVCTQELPALISIRRRPLQGLEGSRGGGWSPARRGLQMRTSGSRGFVGRARLGTEDEGV